VFVEGTCTQDLTHQKYCQASPLPMQYKGVIFRSFPKSPQPEEEGLDNLILTLPKGNEDFTRTTHPGRDHAPISFVRSSTVLWKLWEA